MTKMWKKHTALFLALALGATMVSCGKSDQNKQAEKAQTKVWSTWSSVKVMQNQKDLTYDELEAKCDIQMMKDETEGAQLIITAAKDISSYDLITSELNDGKGNTISTDAIDVYHQKYIVVNSKTDVMNEDIIIGDHVPDMLLPLETAKEYGENTISAGNNQGITVEITTTEDTVPGVYTGSFILKMDEESIEIPVSVEIWDIDLEGKREFQSSFLVYANAMLAGEYEVSDELIERYQEFLLDYKLNTFVIRTDNSVEKLVKEAVTFSENDNYNSICIPNTLTPEYELGDANSQLIMEYITEIVKISTAKKPYFKYLYIYPAAFDEVDVYPEKYEDFVRVFEKGGDWEQTLDRALELVKETKEYKGFSAKLKKEVDEAILNIPAVLPLTSNNKEWIDNLGITFCPKISLYDEQGMTQRYQRQAEKLANGEMWVYTCVGPTNPYPTFHIDDYNLGTRVTGWMCKKYDINGYLYWAVNLYEPIDVNIQKNVNPYTTAERAGDCAGDGFLVYPGAYYGSEYPFASTRLVAFRDTMDDYDMLSVYETLLEEKAKSYGIEIDYESCVEDLYDSLFNGTKYYTDEALVVAAREKLAQRILALKSELGLIAVFGDNSTTLYATAETLTVDGSEIQGTERKGGYEFVITNEEGAGKELTISSGDVSALYRLNATKELEITEVAKSSDNKAFINDGVLEATIISEAKENEGAMTRFRPYIQFAVDDLAGSKGLSFNFNLLTGKEVEAKVQFVMSDMTTKDVDTFLADGKRQKVEISYHEGKFTDEVLADVTAIRISFDNTDSDGKLLADRKLSLEDIYMEMR